MKEVSVTQSDSCLDNGTLYQYLSAVFPAVGAWWWPQQGGTVNNHHTSVWRAELMSAQLKVSLHHVATWSPSSIHLSPCCLCWEMPCHHQRAYSTVAKSNTHHFVFESEAKSLALIVTNVLRFKQFSYVNLMHSNTMQYVLTLSEHASLRVPFVLLWCIHSALWNAVCMKLYTEPNWSHPTYNPSILLAAIWPYYFGETGENALQ